MSGGSFSRNLTGPCRPHQHTIWANVGIDQFDTMIGKHKLTHLIRVRDSASFQNVESAVTFAVRFDVLHQQPGIH